MFYDGKQITEDEPYVKPAGGKVMQPYADRPEEIKELEERFAKKYQGLLKNIESNSD